MEAKQQIVTRKPKLAPIRVVNTHHLRYIQEKEREKELQTLMTAGQKTGGLAVDRPISEPGSVRVTHDADEDGEGVLAASRPSTRNTIKDGIVIRWDTDQKPMLRRPRTSVISVQRKKPSIAKARVGVVLTHSKAKGIITAINQAALDSKSEETAAELSLEESRDLSNPYRQSKDLVLKQYGIWNGAESQNMTLPPIIMSTSLPGHGKHQKRSNNLGSTQLKVKNRLVRRTVDHLPVIPIRSNHIYSQPNCRPRKLVSRSLAIEGTIGDLVTAMRGLL